MKSKIRNTEKMWGEEGYDIEAYSIKYLSKNVYAEYHLTFKKKNNEEVSFEEEWKTLKTLAARQGFCIMPVTHSNQDGHAEVLLINKISIKYVDHEFSTLQEEIRKTYWHIQGDEQFAKYIEQVNNLETMIGRIDHDLRMMGSHVQSNDLFKAKGYPTIANWNDYKIGIHNLQYKLKRDGRSSEEMKMRISGIFDLYRY